MIFSKRKTIGLFISKSFDVFDQAVFHTLEQEAKRLDYDVFVFANVGYRSPENGFDVQERNIFTFAPVEKLDGIIMVPDSYEQDGFRELLYRMLERAACPIVAIRHEGKKYDCIYTNEQTSLRPLVRHLIRDHGLTRIGFLTGFPGHREGDMRKEAYLAEMEANGLSVPDGWICPGTMWMDCGEQAYQHFFADPENPPQAVVCANDYMAVALMRVLRDKGIRVPEDVIVTGFDNVPDLGIDVPSLTTIQPDYPEMVVQAMTLLDRKIKAGAGAQAEPQTRISLDGQLVLGESCSCKKRPPDFYRQTSLSATASLERKSNHEVRMNYFAIELSSCDNLQELHDALIRKKDDSPWIRDYYLCLFTRNGKMAQSMTDTVTLVHLMRDHQDCGMPMITFERSKLLPPMAERADEPQLFFVRLLHQRENNYGYGVFRYEAGEAPTSAYILWNVQVSAALQNMQKREELQALYEERRLSSITDLLTGLLNRRGLVEKLEPQWGVLREHETAFVGIDMDNLKGINDTYGHAAGDFAIRLVARAIRESLPENAFAARMGGDEYTVFLPIPEVNDPVRFIRTFEQKLEHLNRIENRTFTVTASAGYATLPGHPDKTVEQCLQASDAAMYKMKEEHRITRGKPMD